MDVMHCHHFDANRCQSCALLRTEYEQQLADKEAHARSLLREYRDIDWLPAVASAEAGFRNKAKMVVTGTMHEPVLGILETRPGNATQTTGIDLHDCPLYNQPMQDLLTHLAAFITTAQVEPYNLATRRGELKYVLVTQSPDDEYLVRFVLRSQESVTRLRKHLPAFLAAHPQVVVFSVNLQPEHKAILEGEREIILTERETLTMRVGGIPLNLRPQSFFQTNTPIAAALYAQAREWAQRSAPTHAWDLFCGVGGFALHLAPLVEKMTGIEISADAIASARQTARDLGITNLEFDALDATAFSRTHAGSKDVDGPQLIVVNPPRRGIGQELARFLNASPAHTVIYSSCNAETLVRDLAHMPGLRPVAARVLDMFPHTSHYEVIVLLERTE